MLKTRFFFSLLLSSFLISCSSKDYTGWQTKINGEAYSCIFLPENKMVLSTSSGLVCYNLDSGKREWKVDGIMTLYTPIVINETLITGIFGESGLYSISIKDGKVEKLFNTEERIYSVQVQDDKNILAVTQDVTARKYVLRRFSMADGVIGPVQ